MSNRSIDHVNTFHKLFDVEVNDEPHISDPDLNQLRLDLLKEELKELEKALLDGDKIEVLDALTDLQYVLDGTYLSLGMHRLKNAAFIEVHMSNMSKLGDNGKPVFREDGKILKGPNYRPPNLGKLFEMINH